MGFKSFKKYLSITLTSVLALGYIVLFIILVLLMSPIFVLRFTVSKLAKICRPQLYGMLSPFNAMFLKNGVEDAERSNVVFTLITEGKINGEELLEKIKYVFFESRNEKGNLLYPEFKMYVTYWIGFPFWKMESDFNTGEHFRWEKIPETHNFLTEQEYAWNFENEQVKKPFTPGKSPWEIVLLEGDSNTYFNMFWHHSLCDGQAAYKILMKLMDSFEPFHATERQLRNPSSKFKQCLRCLALPFKAAYECVLLTKMYLLYGSPWNLKRGEKSNGEERVIAKSRTRISSDKIKMVANQRDVSFSAVLHNGLLGALRTRYSNQGQRIPQKFIFVFPVPTSIHPGTLTNVSAGVSICLPIGISDPTARLQTCQNELNKLKQSGGILVLNAISGYMYGSFPRWIIGNIGDDLVTLPFRFSNFPGPKNSLSIVGKKLTDIYFSIWTGGIISFYLTMISYNGGIRLIGNADPKLFPNEAALQKFMDDINAEIQALLV